MKIDKELLKTDVEEIKPERGKVYLVSGTSISEDSVCIYTGEGVFVDLGSGYIVALNDENVTVIKELDVKLMKA